MKIKLGIRKSVIEDIKRLHDVVEVPSELPKHLNYEFHDIDMDSFFLFHQDWENIGIMLHDHIQKMYNWQNVFSQEPDFHHENTFHREGVFDIARKTLSGILLNLEREIKDKHHKFLCSYRQYLESLANEQGIIVEEEGHL